jgi:ElaB/YqjD/DUF883 family membrane-anchored ribosome-binding protein
MTANNVGNELDSVKEDLAKLRSDIANLTQALKDVTSETVHEQIGLIRGRIDGIAEDAKSHGRETLDSLTDHIEEKPLASVLIAFGVGILIGRLFDR